MIQNDMLSFEVVIILFVIGNLLLILITRNSQKGNWNYTDTPYADGRYIIRFVSGVSMEADFYDGEWHDLEGDIIDRYEVDCWKVKES